MKIFSRSRRDLGENRGEIAARFWPPRFPYLSAISATGRDHDRDRGVILRRDRGEIMARYGKSRQKRAAISPRFSPRSRRDHGEIREISVAKNAPRNLGGQIRGEMLQRDRGEIRKSRRPKRAEIAR